MLGDEGAAQDVEAVLRGLDRPADPPRPFADGLEARLLAALTGSETVAFERGLAQAERGQAMPRGRPPAPTGYGGASWAPSAASAPERRDGRGRRVSPAAQVATAAVVALALLSGAVVAWIGGRGPSSPGETADVPYALYIPDSDGRGLLRLDPLTLHDAGDVQAPGSAPAGTPGSVVPRGLWWLASADGSTLVRIEEVSGDPMGSEGPEEVDVVVLDGPTGPERARFHPPVWPAVARLSADGSRLVLRDWEARLTADSTVDYVSTTWHVVETATGRTIDSFHTEEPSVLPGFEDGRWDGWATSPDGERLYRLVHRDRPDGLSVAVVAVDLVSGAEIWRLLSPGLDGGMTPATGPDGRPLDRIRAPALAVSPDGRELALIAADGATVMLIDAETAADRGAVRLDPPTPRTFLEFVDDVAEEGGQPVVGTLWSAVYAPDGNSLYLTGLGGDVPEDGRQAVRSYGVRRVDLASGSVVQGPPMLVHDVVPSPEGASLYVLAFVPEEDGTPAMGTWLMLHRLDGATLRDAVIPRGFAPSTLFGGQLVLIAAPVDG